MWRPGVEPIGRHLGKGQSTQQEHFGHPSFKPRAFSLVSQTLQASRSFSSELHCHRGLQKDASSLALPKLALNGWVLFYSPFILDPTLMKHNPFLYTGWTQGLNTKMVNSFSASLDSSGKGIVRNQPALFYLVTEVAEIGVIADLLSYIRLDF